MTAEVLSVGTELLLGQIVDTHAPTMARILADCGISCVRRETVGDNLERIVEALRGALGRADLVVTIGGLGPTVDDLTRDAIASALGDALERVPDYEERLRKMLAYRKIPWNETIARQADRPASGRFIDNPNGSAPGLICEKGGKTVIALPGPRGEFNPMADGPVRDYLERLRGGQVIHSRILRVCGMGESQVEEAIRPLMDGANPTVAPYAHPGEVHLRVTARAPSREEADRLIDPVHDQIGAILGDALFGVDATTLEEAVIGLLRERGEMVAVAESMTGGGLGQRLTNVAGSSAAFAGGVIAYSANAKVKLLGVDPEALRQFGPVSGEVAEAMALGIRERLATTYAVSVTGNAGPTADVDGKPVGLAFVGVAHPGGCESEELRFRGGRAEIRQRSAQSALVALRNVLLSP
ncbi:MAG TPA: competence/damage-inducible protein A [Fimbriimonadaceae bacterium]|nr:competence/damage-inducible protein A [Fimbriimonadaceae bacterium]